MKLPFRNAISGRELAEVERREIPNELGFNLMGRDHIL